ncbi:hypothetical protein HHI36_021669 [Cryptolaemus montrouzieri]|uniref:Uncharacterized protein n=1 Tax=Cryptolaemus montrouzieri TaxID=559131 RepID=A0ABD2MXW0_9CUCU
MRDEVRVNKRFQNAAQNGIVICQGAVSCKSILDHLATGPVILLTNVKLLRCDLCRYNRASSEFKKIFRWPATYQGHYIVLCGYDIFTHRVFYRNPGLTDRTCVMPLRNLEQARKSYGTDQDAIFIYPS